MTGPEYLTTIQRLGMSGAQTAELFGYTRQIHYSTWIKKGPPQSVAMLLRLMARLGYTPAQMAELSTRPIP